MPYVWTYKGFIIRKTAFIRRNGTYIRFSLLLPLGYPVLRGFIRNFVLKNIFFISKGYRSLRRINKKKLNNLEAELLGIQVAYQLPLASFFIFNPFFLILPNLLNSSTFIPFFLALFRFFSGSYIVLLYLVYLILYYLTLLTSW